MSLPARPCRPAALTRPDPEALLLTAVRRRDPQAASRLVQQWVHRRGVGALETFQRTTLPGVEGEEACRWLERLLAFPAESFSPFPAVTSAVEGEVLAPAAAETASSGAPLFVGLLQLEPAHLASLAAIDPWALPPAGPTEPLDFAADLAGSGEIKPILPPPVPPQSTVQPQSTVLPQPGLMPQPSDPEMPSAEASDPAPMARSRWQQRFGFVREGLVGGRRSLAGVRSLLRDCLDEALVHRQQGAAEETGTPAGSQADPLPGGGSGERQAVPPVPAQRPLPADTSLEESLPAPTPAALADLRAWLPDSGDLPRAC